MKNIDTLTDAIGGIDDKMIEKAYERRANKKSRAGVWEIVGIAASFVFIAGFAFLLSRFTEKNVNQAAYGGTDQLLYEKDFTDYNTHNIGFTSDDGALEYELKLILPSDERFFFKCYAKVINKSGNEIELHRLPDYNYNSFFYLENLLKSAEYEQTFVYKGNAKKETVKLKPGESYEELLTYTDGVNKNMKNDYVQYVHDVSGYLTVTVILDPEMSRTWGKSFYWFEGKYYKNNGKTIEIGEDDYGYFICEDQRVKGLEGFIGDSYEDPISGQHIEVDGYGISEELISMENPPTLYYKPGDKIDFINDPAHSFNCFQLWDKSGDNTIDFGGDLYNYLKSNPGRYYLTAELKQGKRYTSMGVKLIVESSSEKIVFMTPQEVEDVTKIHVTSLPGSYDYSFEGEDTKPITDYLTSLHPLYIEDNGGLMDGMTWVIELTYRNGTVKEIYHMGTEICKSGDGKKYYQLSYEEGRKFDTVLWGSKNSAKTPPADFSFSLVWNTFGISSYDSKTGRLIKTSDTSNIKKYTTAYKMTDSELATVYNLLIQLKDYPENYDPYNDPSSETRVGSEPNHTVIVKFTADGIEKTITCSEICNGVNGGYNEAAKKFLQIEKQIEDMLTSTKQWQALPDYEFLYI